MNKNTEACKRWRKRHPDRWKESLRKYKEGHVEEVKEWNRKSNKTRYESIRDYARQHIMFVNGKAIRVDKRHRPNDICEVCGKQVKRLDYHHWDNNHLKWGVWVCMSCHRLADASDKGLHIKYLQLKHTVEQE